MGATVLVMGSSNTDLVCTVDHLPVAGETVPSTDYRVAGGGKAANQAVAAARAGAPTAFLGAVGDDAFGRQRLAELRGYDVDCSNVSTVEGVSSGLAFIFVDKGGENQIVTYAGANDSLTADQVTAAMSSSEPGILLMTLEAPALCVERAIRIASSRGFRMIINAAPYACLVEAYLDATDTLIVNEIEARQIANTNVDLSTAPDVGRELQRRGPRNVAITLGAAGVVLVDGASVRTIPAPKVEVVDTTGAGDAFSGVFAASLAEGADPIEAGERAVVAGALAVTRHGAQPSLPSRQEIEDKLGDGDA